MRKSVRSLAPSDAFCAIDGSVIREVDAVGSSEYPALWDVFDVRFLGALELGSLNVSGRRGIGLPGALPRPLDGYTLNRFQVV